MTTYIVKLTPTGPGAPAELRLRRLLKLALRHRGLRCVNIEAAMAAGEAQDAAEGRRQTTGTGDGTEASGSI